MDSPKEDEIAARNIEDIDMVSEDVTKFFDLEMVEERANYQQRNFLVRPPTPAPESNDCMDDGFVEPPNTPTDSELQNIFNRMVSVLDREPSSTSPVSHPFSLGNFIRNGTDERMSSEGFSGSILIPPGPLGRTSPYDAPTAMKAPSASSLPPLYSGPLRSKTMFEIGSLHSALFEPNQKFKQEFTGMKEKPLKWLTCVGRSSMMLKDASGAMYIREYFSEETKMSTATMIESLQSSFNDVLIESDWMENSTKEYAIEKLASMEHMVGYPDFMQDDKKLDKLYEGLDVTDSDSVIDAGKKILFFIRNTSFSRLTEPVDRKEFPMSPATVNAFYNPQTNTMVFLAAFLQLPLFHKDYPKVFNYGGLGSVAGHEMTHGFDDTGRLFDKIGNLVEWLDNNTATAFAEKSQCFVDQYGSIEIPETKQKLSGLFTLGENIADNGGVNEAFRAFKKFEEKYGAERPIPGFEQYSNNQMFYIGYAQAWCSKDTPEFAALKLLIDHHAPNVYRVNTVDSNQPELAEAFKCPANSPIKTSLTMCSLVKFGKEEVPFGCINI